MNTLIQRMARMIRLGEWQARPDWIAQFVLRPDYEPIVMPENQKILYNLGVRNYRSALAFLREWSASSSASNDHGMFVLGTRDMCWQLSWLLEILEGRYADAIADQYEPNYYLNCRYGVRLYDDLWYKLPDDNSGLEL